MSSGQRRCSQQGAKSWDDVGYHLSSTVAVGSSPSASLEQGSNFREKSRHVLISVPIIRSALNTEVKMGQTSGTREHLGT